MHPPPTPPTPRGRAPTYVGWYLTPLRPFVQERVHSHVDRRLQPVRPTQQLDGLLRVRVRVTVRVRGRVRVRVRVRLRAGVRVRLRVRG